MKVAIVGVDAFQVVVLEAIDERSQVPAAVHESVVPEILQFAVPISEISYVREPSPFVLEYEEILSPL